MSKQPLVALVAALMILGGCAQLDAWTDTSKRGAAAKAVDPASGNVVDIAADEIYLNSDTSATVQDYRNVYIAPANLANMQVIQPEGAHTDAEWWVTDVEDSILQNALLEQFSLALSLGLAFNIVDTREQAQIIVNTAIVAIHPNETRSAIAEGGKPGGAITVSIALVDTASGRVLMRAVDTTSSDDIWAFNEVAEADPAINQVFSAWGESVRRGLLEAQARSAEAPYGPVTPGN